MLRTMIILIITITITISLALVNAFGLSADGALSLGPGGKPIAKSHTIISNSSKVCATNSTNQPTSIAISTDRRNYIVGDALQIYIYALDKNGCAVATKVILTLDDDNSGAKYHIFVQSLYSDSDPDYDVFLPPLNFQEKHNPSNNSFLRYNQFVLTQPGNYTLTAKLANATLANGTEQASTTFHVDNLIFSSPARILYVTIAFFAGLLFVIALGINNYALSEILRFICISGIIISVVLFLVL